jgi:hypothetical protein
MTASSHEPSADAVQTETFGRSGAHISIRHERSSAIGVAVGGQPPIMRHRMGAEIQNADASIAASPRFDPRLAFLCPLRHEHDTRPPVGAAMHGLEQPARADIHMVLRIALMRPTDHRAAGLRFVSVVRMRVLKVSSQAADRDE